MSRYEKKLKDKIDDEIKLAGLKALVPEELEKQLILNPIACELSRMRAWRLCEVSGGEIWFKDP